MRSPIIPPRHTMRQRRQGWQISGVMLRRFVAPRTLSGVHEQALPFLRLRGIRRGHLMVIEGLREVAVGRSAWEPHETQPVPADTRSSRCRMRLAVRCAAAYARSVGGGPGGGRGFAASGREYSAT